MTPSACIDDTAVLELGGVRGNGWNQKQTTKKHDDDNPTPGVQAICTKGEIKSKLKILVLRVGSGGSGGILGWLWVSSGVALGGLWGCSDWRSGQTSSSEVALISTSMGI